MTSGHAGPARVVRSGLPVLLAAVLLAGCRSTSGVRTLAGPREVIQGL